MWMHVIDFKDYKELMKEVDERISQGLSEFEIKKLTLEEKGE